MKLIKFPKEQTKPRAVLFSQRLQELIVHHYSKDEVITALRGLLIEKNQEEYKAISSAFLSLEETLRPSNYFFYLAIFQLIDSNGYKYSRDLFKEFFPAHYYSYYSNKKGA